MSPTQGWPCSQQALSVRISSEIAHESIVSLKATQQRVYFMRRVWKEEGVERGETHMKPGKVKKSSKEVKTTKLNYRTGWRVATTSVGAWNVSPQNTSPGLRESALPFAGVGGGNRQHPFPLHIPNTLPAKQHPAQHVSAQAEQHHHRLNQGILVFEESAPCDWISCVCLSFSLSWTIKAPVRIHQLGRQTISLPYPATQFYETYRNSVPLKQFQLWETWLKQVIWLKHAPKQERAPTDTKTVRSAKAYLKIPAKTGESGQRKRTRHRNPETPPQAPTQTTLWLYWFVLDFGWRCSHCCYSTVWHHPAVLCIHLLR